MQYTRILSKKNSFFTKKEYFLCKLLLQKTELLYLWEERNINLSNNLRL